MHARSLVGFSLVTLLAACSGPPKNDQATVSPSPGGVPVPVVANAQSFPQPVVSPTAVVPVSAVPGLITPTNARMRVPTIVTGRADPFAAIATEPIRIAVASKPAVKLPSPLPAPSSGGLPTLTPPPFTQVPLNSTPLPPTLLPAPPSRVSLIDAITISGVIQIGGKWSVIVREPDAQTSRYVHAGDYLANGQVLVKRIVAGVGADPIVILQQNGVEVTRSVGSGGDRLAHR